MKTKDFIGHPLFLISFVAAMLVVFGNAVFFSKTAEVFPTGGDQYFLFSLALLLWWTIVIISLPFNNRLTRKPWLIILIFISGTYHYFLREFGTVIDQTMLVNILETDSREAGEIISYEFFSYMLYAMIIPGMVVLAWPIHAYSKKRVMLATGYLVLFSGMLVGFCLFGFGGHYASFFREHKSLRYYANPVYPIYSAVKLATSSPSGDSEGSFEKIYPGATIPDTDPHRELMVLVVGETARADHFSLYGYTRSTNPMLQRQAKNLYVFKDVKACGTSTTVSLPCMFSNLGRENFDGATAERRDNALDIVARAGVSVLWRDNNSGSKRVADRVRYEDFRSSERNPVCDPECRDIGMLHGLQEYIDAQEGDILIVLHQMGSHGPAYYKRVPQEFYRFQPVCMSNQLNQCSKEEIVNAYDNSILYTDFFLSKVIELVKNNADKFEAAMLYVSDHGESLGEKGLYLHGLPYLIAPAAQTKVPVLLWLGENNDVDESGLLWNINKSTSHDFLFDTILGYFEIEEYPGKKLDSFVPYENY